MESEDKNDWLHALELSNFCQKLDTKSDSNSIHSSIQSDLLKKVANSESSPLARNFYLTSPNSGVNVDTSFPNEMQVAAISDPDYLDIEVLFDSMTTKILPSVGIDNWVLKIDLVDIGSLLKRQFILYLSNKVLRRVDDFVEFEPNSTITCSENDFRKVLANPLNAVGRLMDGSIEVEGGKMSLINFLRNLKP
jgi:alkyl sulfatase BDS1-like metallo-beta-lactamase superfamily hydrolase